MTNVNVYLLDEPSSFLDSEQRIIASKVIKRFVLHAKKTAFVIEHDFIMATYLADRVIVFEGQPAIAATATPYVWIFATAPHFNVITWNIDRNHSSLE
jgi:ATP-binding cassette subfamily E protein 1